MKPSFTSLYSNFEHGKNLNPDNPFLGTRRGDTYEWITYNQVAEKRTLLGSVFVDLLGPGNHFIGIYSINRAEWVIAEHACYAYSNVNVALCN